MSTERALEPEAGYKICGRVGQTAPTEEDGACFEGHAFGQERKLSVENEDSEKERLRAGLVDRQNIKKWVHSSIIFNVESHIEFQFLTTWFTTVAPTARAMRLLLGLLYDLRTRRSAKTFTLAKPHCAQSVTCHGLTREALSNYA